MKMVEVLFFSPTLALPNRNTQFILESEKVYQFWYHLSSMYAVTI